ncbi:MAG TPA: Trm112 family protein [Abditibacteriaceae bacterium]
MALIDSQLLNDLRCPHCGGELQEDEAAVRLRCTKCALAYPFDDGIPVLLVEEADKPEGFTG